jgi:hypothetical protein
MESEGSEPDMAACLAAARLSTSSTIYIHIMYMIEVSNIQHTANQVLYFLKP